MVVVRSHRLKDSSPQSLVETTMHRLNIRSLQVQNLQEMWVHTLNLCPPQGHLEQMQHDTMICCLNYLDFP
uniref:Uncharacterized protein n=1 Tax=Arundo donax TaxID=35708 RepID=A0A0A8YQK2_ARUDO